MNFVYIARSLKDGKFYIGCTTNVARRLEEHNKGKTPCLKNRRPLKIVYVEEYDDAGTAFEREKQIKSYKGGSAFKKLINNTGGFA